MLRDVLSGPLDVGGFDPDRVEADHFQRANPPLPARMLKGSRHLSLSAPGIQGLGVGAPKLGICGHRAGRWIEDQSQPA